MKIEILDRIGVKRRRVAGFAWAILGLCMVIGTTWAVVAVQAQAIDDEPTTPVWEAQLTVGVNDASVPAVSGFSLWGQDFGSLSQGSFRLDDQVFRILTIQSFAGGLFLNLSRQVSVDFILTIDGIDFVASESLLPPTPAAGRYWWPGDRLNWAEGEILDVSIAKAHGTATIPARAPARPVAFFINVPERHDGVDAFTTRLNFSEDMPLSFRTLRDHAIEATNGKVTKSRRVVKGSSMQWSITVRPDGDADVEIVMTAAADCQSLDSICSDDARILYNSPAFTVPGPASSPPSDDASLTELTIVGTQLSPSFEPAVTLYTATTEATEVTIAVNGNDADAIVDIRPDDADTTATGHQVELTEGGETAITLTVTAADGETTETYWLVITHDASGSLGGNSVEPSAGLTGLQLDGLSSLNFQPEVSRYTTTAPDETTATTVLLARQETGATIEILTVRSDNPVLSLDDADADDSQTGHQAQLAANGDTLILVRITSSDGLRQELYVILVDDDGGTQTRSDSDEPDSILRKTVDELHRLDGGNGAEKLTKSTNNQATAPKLNSLALSDGTLTPAFSSETTSYTAEVSATVSQVTISAAATDQYANVLIAPSDADSNAAGWQVDLVGSERGSGPSETLIAVIVRSPDGNALNAYKIKMLRQEPEPNNVRLADLSIDDVSIHPRFDQDTYSYAAQVRDDVDVITLLANPSDSTATVEVTPEDSDANTDGYQIELEEPVLDGGPATTNISVVVTSSDEIGSQTYVIKVKRAALPVLGWKQIDAGWFRICGIRMDDTVACRSIEVPRDVDLGAQVGRTSAAVPEDLGIALEVVAGATKVCALLPDGEVRCWGIQGSNRRNPTPDGFGSSTNLSDAGLQVHKYTIYGGCRILNGGSADCPGMQPSEQLRAGPYKAIGSARDFACGLDTSNIITCWNLYGNEVGSVPNDVEYKSFAVGGVSVCGIRMDDSTLDCWEHNTPFEYVPDGSFVSVDVGYGPIACGLRPDNTVECWLGRPDERYVAPGGGSIVPLLNEVPDEDTIGYKAVSIDRGGFACGIRLDDSLACWGWNHTKIAKQTPGNKSKWRMSAHLLDIKLNGGTLRPDFDKDVLSYNVSVGNSVATLEIEPEMTNSYQTYEITSDTDQTIAVGVVDLSVGTNVVTILSESQDGLSTRTYTITVERGP